MGIGAKLNAMAAYQGGGPPPNSGAPQHFPNPAAPPFPPPPQPATPSAPSSAPARQSYYQAIRNKLGLIVGSRKLHRLYPADRLDFVASHVDRTVDFVALAQQWHLPLELALDLCTLALYDIVIYADDSGSMQGDRWDLDLRTIVQRTASVATLFDSDGISVRFMNGKHDKDHIRTEADVMKLFKKASPDGVTPIGTSLKAKVLDPYLKELRKASQKGAKPLLVLTITDGAPYGEARDTLATVILEAHRALEGLGYSGNEVAYQFAQVGDDSNATDFLDELDNHPKVGGFIDATSNFEEEAMQWNRRSGGMSEMTPDLYLVKLLCGAVDDDWDAKDGDQPRRPREKAKDEGGCVVQ